MSDPKKPGQGVAPEAPGSTPTALPTRIRNPGPNPRHYWMPKLEARARDGFFAPGECRDITPEQAEHIQKAIVKGQLTTKVSVHPKTGAVVLPSVEFTSDPVVTAADLLAAEEKRLAS